MTKTDGPSVHHIKAKPEDFGGNKELGRFVLMPGSDGRAKAIAERFQDLRVCESSRRLNCYLGSYQSGGVSADFAVVSSGMGCPSMDIVINELLMLGARRFLRVGTAGSMQDYIRFGDLVIASGSVRDEATTQHYTPLEVPAIADAKLVLALEDVARLIGVRTHTGIVHCKDSLFAREFGVGPMAESNQKYMDLLTSSGVLASEMETSALFIRCQVAAAEIRRTSQTAIVPRAGAILSIIGDAIKHDGDPFSKKDSGPVIDSMIDLALETGLAFTTAEMKESAAQGQ